MFKRLARHSAPDLLLRAADCVAIDLETTGLHAAKGDEIVALAGVRVMGGKVRQQEAFARLVDPGRPIPPRAIEIHGITDSMVAGASSVLDGLAALRTFVGNAVVIGYSVGFDLEFMARSRPNGAIEFNCPTLCILRLSEYLEPSSRDHSLEAVAARFGVSISGRHTALGDAMAAAEIFVQMLPRLEAHGVRTLKEARRAVRRAHFLRRLHLSS